MKLDKRQKILITLIVIAFAYVAWQIYDLMGGDSSEAVVPAKPAVRVETVRSNTPASTTVQTTTTATPATPILPAAVQQPVTSVTTTASNPTPVQQPLIAPAMTGFQRQYMRLLNQYQLVKLQRQVIDEQVAIANAQSKIAQLSGATQKAGVVSTSAAPLTIVGSTSGTSSTYSLAYLDNQGSKWTATLNKNGSLVAVNVGDVLSDGTEILEISKKGVILKRFGRRYLLTFTGTLLLKSPTYVRPVTTRTKAEVSDLFPVSAPKPAPAPVSTITTTVQPSQIPPAVQATTTSTTVTVPPTITKPAATTTTTTTAVSGLPSIANSSTTTTTVKSTPPTVNNNALLPQHTVTVTKTAPTAQTTTTTTKMNAAPTTTTTTVTSQTTKPMPGNVTAVAVAPTTPTPAMDSKVLAQTSSNFNLTPQQQTKVAELATVMNSSNQPQTYTEAEKTLLTVPNDYYTIQLMGSREMNDLTNMIKTYKLKNTYIFQTTYLEKPWFVLVYGSYKTETAANNAIKQLPVGVQQMKPWVRPMLSVHNAIKR